MKKFTPVFIVFVFLLGSLYVGAGGLAKAKLDEKLQELDSKRAILIKQAPTIRYKDLDFDNQYEQRYYLAVHSVERHFPWAIGVSNIVGLIITSMCFGLIGSIVSIVRGLVAGINVLESVRVMAILAQGVLIGLIVLGLSFVIPAVLVKGSEDLKPISLMFISLFGGMFANKFFEKVETYFNRLFLS